MAATSAEGLDILVLGGSGFVSSTVCRVALRAGHRVWAVTRTGSGVPEGTTALVADRRDGAALAGVLKAEGRRWDMAIDCIGYEAEDARQDVALLPDFVDHIGFISSDAVFDYREPDFMKDERFDQFATGGYGGGKRACEEVFEAAPPSISWTIVRPTHVYGPGSEFGCLPMHLRDTQLLARLRRGAELPLVANGFLLQQPILARDLAAMILSSYGLETARRQIFMAAGPEVFEARRYYELLGEKLGVAARIREESVEAFATSGSKYFFTICHRVYAMTKAAAAGLAVPSTPFAVGLEEHLRWALETRGG